MLTLGLLCRPGHIMELTDVRGQIEWYVLIEISCWRYLVHAKGISIYESCFTFTFIESNNPKRCHISQ